jgi:hypothetical protein
VLSLSLTVRPPQHVQHVPKRETTWRIRAYGLVGSGSTAVWIRAFVRTDRAEGSVRTAEVLPSYLYLKIVPVRTDQGVRIARDHMPTTLFAQ